MNILLRDKTPHICIIGNGWWGKGLREALALKNYNVTVFNSKSCLRDLLTLNCDLVFECTGDIEAARRETLLSGSVSGNKIYPLIINPEDKIDIDSIEDFKIAEKRLKY